MELSHRELARSVCITIVPYGGRKRPCLKDRISTSVLSTSVFKDEQVH